MSASLKKPISIGRNRLHVSCSIGISIFPDCCTTADELIKCADNALYRSKHLGRDRHTLFLNKE
ncbi:diguanylate cyclase domain-containing protein [Candidatus Reidiella endopervernicosa]|nr:diguanylate cyclase [Candidatus Reidiella endopervernicosa]